jgi:hypothetical protein
VDVKAHEPEHVIELNGNGLIYDLRPGKGHDLITDEGKVSEYLSDTVWGAFQQSHATNLLLFVHGGLNDRDQGLQHYLDNSEQIDQRGYYPVFIVWPSGWPDTYVEHLLWVRQGLKMETTGEKIFSITTTPLMLFADVGRAITRLPMVVANNTRSDRETVIPARKLDGGSAVRDYQRLAAEGRHVEIGDDYSRGSDRFLRTVSYWATLPVKYVAASLIDGFGKGAWDDMLRRTQTVYPARRESGALTPGSDTNNAAPPAPQPTVRTGRHGTRKAKHERHYAAAGFPMFLELLEKSQSNAPSPIQVTLVGHSMGTMILNRVIRDTKIDFTNIVYLAAACSLEDFSTSVLPYLHSHTNTEFYGLSLHPVAEAGEWYLIAGDLVPRGSLLTWIDNFLANPVSEEERTLGKWQNLFRAGATGQPALEQFFDYGGSGSVSNRLHFRAFSVGFGDQLRPDNYQWNEHPVHQTVQERCNQPLSHGEFTEMPYWLSEFWWKN